MTLADRIVVLNNGHIEQVGTPMQLYGEPENLFVARFIGSPSMNILSGRIGSDGQVAMAGGERIPLLARTPDLQEGTKVSVGIRPEDLRIVSEGEGMFAGTVSLVEQLGEFQLLYMGAEELIVKVDGTTRVLKGQTVHLAADTGSVHIFDASGRSVRRRHV